MRTLGGLALSTAVVLAACIPAPGPSAASPTPPPSTANDLLATDPDLIFVRSGSAAAYTQGTLALISARTGERMKEWTEGVLAPEWNGDRAVRGVMYTIGWTATPGGVVTTVSRIESLGQPAAKSTSFAGWFVPRTQHSGAPDGLSHDGRWLALFDPELKRPDGTFRSRFAILGTALDSAPTQVELGGNFWFEAIADDGKTLYLTENVPWDRPTDQYLRVYDLERHTLVPGNVPLTGPPLTGYPLGVEAMSSDGSRHYRMYAVGRDVSAPVLRSLHVNDRKGTTISLPSSMFSGGEAQIAWALVPTPDGRTVYAVNGELGAVVEFDARTETVRRSMKWDTRSSATGPIDALIRWFLPVAEAKRFVRAGAVLSLDGKWLYLIGPKSIFAVRTEDLAIERRSKAVDDRFTDGPELEALALSPDDARVYAVSDEAARIFVFSALDGRQLGAIAVPQFTSIVRIEQAR